MSNETTLDDVLALVNGNGSSMARDRAIYDYLRTHGDELRAALEDARRWRKHKGSFEVLQSMLDAASPLVLNRLKAIDAAQEVGK